LGYLSAQRADPDASIVEDHPFGGGITALCQVVSPRLTADTITFDPV
jgi:hypothetical protein